MDRVADAALRARAAAGAADRGVRRPTSTAPIRGASEHAEERAVSRSPSWAWGPSCPTRPSVPPSGRTSTEGRYSISEVTADRWDPALYYDPDPQAPDKTYSKIGGWVRDWTWDPDRLEAADPAARRRGHGRDARSGRSPAPREALADYGWPDRPLDPERTAVILGNAMAGERHYLTALAHLLPEYARELARRPSFAALPEALRDAIAAEFAGRRRHAASPRSPRTRCPASWPTASPAASPTCSTSAGPNFVCDAACASAMAAISAAIEGLVEGDFDAVLTGGIDRNMGAVDLRQVLQDRRAVGDRHPPLRRRRRRLRDGRGRGALPAQAPGRRRARRRPRLRRAARHRRRQRRQGQGHHRAQPASASGWPSSAPGRTPGLSPATVSLVEGHGTSTRVGDVVEVESLTAVFGSAGLRARLGRRSAR